MLRKGMEVRVYDGDLFGWTIGTLAKHLSDNRWVIFTQTGYSLNRIIVEEYQTIKKDGCGYVLKTECCPKCGSYEIGDEEENDMCCYDCDTHWDSRSKEIIREGIQC